jgi:hypothetical protein
MMHDQQITENSEKYFLFSVDLPNQPHKLQLVDGLGRNMYNETVNGTTRLNVGQYPSSVYHVIVTDAKGVQTRSKVIVQHD